LVKKLFLLDGMALVYRAHFALIARPILTSKGVNTSALYGFTQTLLDIINKQKPTHLAVAFDTEAPTPRHAAFPEYKATRQAMPGIAEKTAIKLIAEHGTVENLLAHTSDLKGRVKETLETNRDKALLSKQLVTILRDAPCPFDLESLKVRPADDAKLKELFV